MLGQRFDAALTMASELHRDQRRKGTQIPYVSHLISVAAIVLETHAHYPMDNLEDLAIAALLHDAIEDQGHKINLDHIKEQFGETVHRIVLECSDAIVTEEGEKKADWNGRKEAYLSKIAVKSPDTLIVSCADKIHNARCILADHSRLGDDIWGRFNGGKEGTVWYYQRLSEEFESVWPDNPLLRDFKVLVAHMRTAAQSTAGSRSDNSDEAAPE